MTHGWWSPPRWNADGPERQRCDRTWPAGPSTATAPRIPVTSGDCDCTCCAPSHGLPVGFALTGAKADERVVLLDILHADPTLPDHRTQTLIGDKNYFGVDFEAALPQGGIELLRPARKGEPERPGARFFKPLRQVIESINDTFKGQLDPERHGGRTKAGVIVRVWQRILALTAAIWHNDNIGQPVKRSLIAYDH